MNKKLIVEGFKLEILKWNDKQRAEYLNNLNTTIEAAQIMKDHINGLNCKTCSRIIGEESPFCELRDCQYKKDRP